MRQLHLIQHGMAAWAKQHRRKTLLDALPVEGLFASHAWRSTAAVCAQGVCWRTPQALMDDWREDAHALHVARMALMLADHVFSSLPRGAQHHFGPIPIPAYWFTQTTVG